MPQDAKTAPAKDKEDLISKLLTRFSSDNPYFLLDEMTIAVNAQKEYAATKGIAFNCRVIACVEDNFHELSCFLNNLERNKHIFPDTTRMQYVLRYSGENAVETLHWTTTDIQIRNGNLTFYLVDSAEMLDSLFLQLLLINTICPGAQVYYTNLKIQKDVENCGTFALDIAMALAKITNLYELLAAMFAPIEVKLRTLTCAVSYGQSLLNQIDNETLEDHGEVEFFYSLLKEDQIKQLTHALQKLKHIPRGMLLQQCGSLFKNNQDKTLDTEGVLCRNKKPLDEFIQENQGEYTRKGKTKFGNLAIVKKSKKTNERYTTYIQSNREKCASLVANRQNILFFNSPMPNPETDTCVVSLKRHSHEETDTAKRQKKS